MGNPRSRSWFGIGLGTAAVGACAACCAGPLLAILGGIGLASAVGALFAPALVVLAVLAGVGVLVLHRRRGAPRRRSAAAPVRLVRAETAPDAAD
jgi:hypothetical protein